MKAPLSPSLAVYLSTGFFVFLHHFSHISREIFASLDPIGFHYGSGGDLNLSKHGLKDRIRDSRVILKFQFEDEICSRLIFVCSK